MYSLSSQALRKRAPCSDPASASHEHINNLSMYCTPTSNDNCRCTTPATMTLSKNWNCLNVRDTTHPKVHTPSGPMQGS